MSGKESQAPGISVEKWEYDAKARERATSGDMGQYPRQEVDGV